LGLLCAAVWTSPALASTLIVEGTGDGHGVGMSQYGAAGYARHGWTYEQILAHYYTGTTLGSAPAGAVIKVLDGSHVISLPLERYVRGVVAAEMPSSWPLAALEAQAIASRTYALTTDAGGSRFDVYADTRSQMYLGAAAETASSNAAVRDTAGQIVLYAGKPATTYFFASSGGMTESIQNSFIGASPQPWLVGVADPYSGGAAFEWKRSFSFASASRLLRGLVRGSFRGVEVLQRGVSPRIVSAEILGSAGDTQLSGPELAARLGLTSTWAYFSVENGTAISAEPDLSGRPNVPESTAPVTEAPPATAPAPVTPAASTTPQGGAQAPGVAVESLDGGAAAG
jgi:stage II sporulation protein D